ncbi:MAG TPA: hypothetical protein VIY86_07700, partial [Pirellulaceae bacterium]
MLGLRPIFESYLLVGACAVVLFAVLAAVPPRVPSAGKRRVLAWLRGLAFLGLLIGMLRPSLVRTRTRVEPATLVVLADHSRSMTVTDVDGVARWQALRNALDQAWPLLDPFRAALRVDMFQFAAAAERLVIEGQRPNLPETADGEQTDLGGALRDVLRAHASTKLAGVVLLSDGAQRAAPARVEPRQIVR